MLLPDEVVTKVVDYIEKSGAALDEVRLAKEAAAQDAPKTVELLIKKGFLQPAMRESAVIALQDPVKAQASLRKIAEAAFTPPPVLGRPTAEKTADGLPANMKESDRAYYAGLGLL